MSGRKCAVITGFGKFANYEVNPSEDYVNYLQGNDAARNELAEALGVDEVIVKVLEVKRECYQVFAEMVDDAIKAGNSVEYAFGLCAGSLQQEGLLLEEALKLRYVPSSSDVRKDDVRLSAEEIRSELPHLSGIQTIGNPAGQELILLRYLDTIEAASDAVYGVECNKNRQDAAYSWVSNMIGLAIANAVYGDRVKAGASFHMSALATCVSREAQSDFLQTQPNKYLNWLMRVFKIDEFFNSGDSEFYGEEDLYLNRRERQDDTLIDADGTLVAEADPGGRVRVLTREKAIFYLLKKLEELGKVDEVDQGELNEMTNRQINRLLGKYNVFQSIRRIPTLSSREEMVSKILDTEGVLAKPIGVEGVHKLMCEFGAALKGALEQAA
jgi:hypothetical protein